VFFIVVIFKPPTFQGLAFDLVLREEEITIEFTIAQIPLCLFISKDLGFTYLTFLLKM
jgi:hypothetical protein